MKTDSFPKADAARSDDTSAPDASSNETPGSSIWLYNGHGEDAPVEIDRSHYPDLDDKELLWADVDLECLDEFDRLWEHLGITEHIEHLTASLDGSKLVQHDDLIELTVDVVRNDPDIALMPMRCLVSRNWIVTVHDGELDLIDEFNKPFHGETGLGELDGPAFLSILLDWQVSGYFRAIETLQAAVDSLDEELLGPSPNERGLLERLQAMRRQLRRLRHALGPQREVLGLLSNPESEALTGSDVSPDYQRLADQVERALEGIDTTREMIVGSFDIFMTRTAQTTNDIMKHLTIVSVLLLPAAVMAGVMGMNFKVPLFEYEWMFWGTLGLMAVTAVITLFFAKRKDWI
ncbi:MAG: magnesium transporter CorA family protein [Acidimicrobiia bacterium]